MPGGPSEPEARQTRSPACQASPSSSSKGLVGCSRALGSAPAACLPTGPAGVARPSLLPLPLIAWKQSRWQWEQLSRCWSHDWRLLFVHRIIFLHSGFC